MPKINLSDDDLKVLSECINNQTEIPEDLLLKLSPGFFEKLRQAGKFDYQELDKYKIPTIEYAGKRPEAVILAQAAITGGAAPLQIVRSFANGKNGDWKNLIVQGDNSQFLKTCYMNQDLLIKDKVKGKVKLIYIDPPFGTGDEYGGNSGEMSYSAKLMWAEFIEGLRERLIFLREILSPDGCIFLRLDYHFGHYIKVIMDEVFGDVNYRNEIIVKRGAPKAGLIDQFEEIASLTVSYDVLFWYSKQSSRRFKKFLRPADANQQTGWWHDFWKNFDRPTLRYELLGVNITKGQWYWIKDKADEAAENYKRFLKESEKTKETLEEYWKRTGKTKKFIRRQGRRIQYWVQPREYVLLDNNWLDIAGYSFKTGYPTENSEELLERVITYATEKDDLVIDVFGGSGTTAAVAEKLSRRWIICDFGKHAIYTMQKRILNISDSKKFGDEVENREKYGQPPKPFCVVSAGAYDFSKIMNLRKNKDAYVSFVLGLFGISREDVDFSKKYKLANIYAEKENNPVEVYPVWEDEYLKDVRIDGDYLKDIMEASGGKLRGDYYIVVPETCTVISDTTLKNRSNEKVNFKLLKFPYKVLEDVSRHFQIEEQASSAADINRLISSAGFYFNEEVKIEVEKARGGFKIAKFKTEILDKNKERFKGLDGLSMLLVDTDYDGEIFDMDIAIYSSEIDKEGFVKVEGLSRDSCLIAIDKHGNESKITKIS